MALNLERDPHWGAVLRRFLQNCEGWVTFLCFLQNEYMKDDFFIKIETWHKPDLGTLENVSLHSKGWGTAALWNAWSTCTRLWHHQDGSSFALK